MSTAVGFLLVSACIIIILYKRRFRFGSGRACWPPCWRHSSVRPCVFYFRAGGLGGPSTRTAPQANSERPGVSPLRSGVTTARPGRVVRWVAPSGRLRSRPESAAVWSWHVPKSAPWLVGRAGCQPHWVSIVVLWRRPRSPARHATLGICTGKQPDGGRLTMAGRPTAQGLTHVVSD